MRRALNFALACLIAIFASELLLRILPYKLPPQAPSQAFVPDCEPHPVLGWQLHPGSHLHRVIPDSEPVMQTVLSNHARSTGMNIQNEINCSNERCIVLIGDSFTQGFGLSDADTFGWILQESLPNTTVFNFGTGGYGTCQSYMRMRELLNNLNFKGSHFVYGFNDFHELRNVADPRYTWRLARASQSGTSLMPYCSVKENRLLFHEPENFPEPFGRTGRYSYVLSLLTDAYYVFAGEERRRSKRKVTELLFLQMHEAALASGGTYATLFMRVEPESKQHYLDFHVRNRIKYYDGGRNDELLPLMLLADGHPNAAMNRHWADLLASALQ